MTVKPITPAVLSIDLLNQLNKHYLSTLYKHYRTPLLGYAPEAIVIYAVTLYNYILRPVGLAPNTTQEDYITYLTKTYREATSTIIPTLDGFIGELEFILDETQYAEVELRPNSISEYINYRKTGADTEDKYNAKHYPTLHDFFYSILSPLGSFPYVNDNRINDIKSKADDLQRRHNERLTIFIRGELLL